MRRRKKNTRLIAIRLPAELLTKIDNLVESINEPYPTNTSTSKDATRSRVIRTILTNATNCNQHANGKTNRQSPTPA